MSQATNWAHKHFIMRKTKKNTSLTECENSHEKEQTGAFCKSKTCLYLSEEIYPNTGQCLLKCLLARNMWKNTKRNNEKSQLHSPFERENVLSKGTYVNSPFRDSKEYRYQLVYNGIVGRNMGRHL